MWIIYAIGMIDVIVLVIGLPCIFFVMRKRAVTREHELNKAIYMMEVQKLLFGTHTDVCYLEKALEKCAEKLQAEQAFILTIESGKTSSLYRYPVRDALQPTQFLTESFSMQLPVISKAMEEQKSLIINIMEDTSADLRNEIGRLNRPNIKSLMFVPIVDSDKKLQAVLGVANFDKRYKTAELLECVTANFLMAILNYNSYQRIERMATVDKLTGLKNRNCYQQDMKSLAEQGHQSMCCIYMDVNGLHEMNNYLGHVAGDEMLQTVGTSILKYFGDEYSYRIGGDEFVVFCKDVTEESTLQKLEDFLRDMEKYHYQISVGSFWQDTSLQIDAMVSNAEKKMYENKRRYYERKGNVSKAREMNRKLEETLLQKQDFEYFLSLIAHYFLGVYVVDFNTDKTRIIYKPSYFDEILKKNENRYRDSLDEYCKKFVKEEDQYKIQEVLDYNNIMEDLADRKVVHTIYEKRDNTRIRLRIFASTDFTEERRETFWLFEEVSARYR